MKGFGIEIKNTLLDPKHVENMGQAVWLYMWLIDHITSVTEEKIGIVLGGKPVKYDEVKDDLGISKNTYSRWIDKLVKYPYIQTTLAPYGIVYKVFKAHKRFTKNQKRFTKKDARFTKNEERNIDNNKTYTKDNAFLKKPFYNGMPIVTKKNGKRYCINEKTGEWLLFVGKESDITYKQPSYAQ